MSTATAMLLGAAIFFGSAVLGFVVMTLVIRPRRRDRAEKHPTVRAMQHSVTRTRRRRRR
jgi:hypothetical protein